MTKKSNSNLKSVGPAVPRKTRFRQLLKSDRSTDISCTLELAKRYVADYPDSPRGWLIYGESLAGTTRYDEALRALRRVLRLTSKKNKPWIQGRIGTLYKYRGNFRRAEFWFRRAAESDPHEATGWILLGGIIARQGRLTEAESIHRRATRCKAGCIDEAWLNLGLVLRAQERYREARACFAKALELDPKYRAAKNGLRDIDRVMELLDDGQRPKRRRSRRSAKTAAHDD